MVSYVPHVNSIQTKNDEESLRSDIEDSVEILGLEEISFTTIDMVNMTMTDHPTTGNHLSLFDSQTLPKLVPSNNPESRGRLSLCPFPFLNEVFRSISNKTPK